MRIDIADLGVFTAEGLAFLTGEVDSLEIYVGSVEEFTSLPYEDQGRIALTQCLAPKYRNGGVSDQEHATAETETLEKETIMDHSTNNFPSESMTRAQVQMLASLVHALDPEQDPIELCQELDSWRGTKTMDKLVADLVNVLNNAIAEMNAEESGDVYPDGHQPYNARTTERLSFSPVRGISISDKRVSWPARSYVRAEATPNGKFNIRAWVDVPTSGPADYVRRNVSRSEFIMED